MESKWQRRKHSVEAKQRSGAGQANTAKGKEHVPEALYGLCSCSVPEPGCSSAREAKADKRSVFTQWQSQDEDVALLVDEEVVHREP